MQPSKNLSNRYILFAGWGNPMGGWNDYVATYNASEDAQKTVQRQGYDWFHIVSTDQILSEPTYSHEA